MPTEYAVLHSPSALSSGIGKSLPDTLHTARYAPMIIPHRGHLPLSHLGELGNLPAPIHTRASTLHYLPEIRPPPEFLLAVLSVRLLQWQTGASRRCMDKYRIKEQVRYRSPNCSCLHHGWNPLYTVRFQRVNCGREDQVRWVQVQQEIFDAPVPLELLTGAASVSRPIKLPLNDCRLRKSSPLCP